MASSSIREAHPELAAAFAVLDHFFASVEPSNLERTKRVLARCCFLWHAAIPAEIINSGEKSGGGINNSIWVPGPEDDWEDTPPRYISGWLDPIEAAGLLTKNEPSSPSTNSNNTNQAYTTTPPPTIPGMPTYHMPPTTQKALTLHLATTSPLLLTTAFQTVLLALRSLYPGRLPPSAPPAPTNLTTPLRTLLAHHISHLTLTFSDHLTQILPQSDDTTTALLRPLQSLLNDLAFFYIHTNSFAPARSVGSFALRISGHPYPPHDEVPLSREEWCLNVDTLLLSAWAWAGISPGQHSAGYMDEYLTFVMEGTAQDEEFLGAVGRAAGFWEQGVEMLEEDGVERGEVVGRVEVLAAVQRAYGEGRRMKGFLAEEEGYDFDNPPDCSGKRKRDERDVGEGRARRGEVGITSPSAEGGAGGGSSVVGGERSSLAVTGTPLGEAVDEESNSGLPAEDGGVENGTPENEEVFDGDSTKNNEERPTEGPAEDASGASQQRMELDAEFDAEFWLLAGNDEEQNGSEAQGHLQGQAVVSESESQKERQNAAIDEDSRLLFGEEEDSWLLSGSEDEDDSEDEHEDEDDHDNEDDHDSKEKNDSEEKDGCENEHDRSQGEHEGGGEVCDLEGPVGHKSSEASDQERQDAALEEEFLLIKEGQDENTIYGSDSEESVEE